jgi:O-antigen/teichoic acid export membrane protein
MFAGIITTIFYWIDSFSIGYFYNPVYVGYYNAAVPIITLLGLVPELFMQLFLPFITKEFSNKNFDTIKQLSQQVGKWILILNLPLFLIMLIFPDVLINILFGKDYLPAVHSLQILSFGGIFTGLVILSQNILFMLGKSKVILINLVCVSIINFALNFFLVPRYGIVGAAIATSVVWFILTVVLFIQVKKYIGIIPLRRKIIRVFIISLIPTALVIYLKSFVEINLFSFIILGLFFFLLYVALIFVTRCLDKNDLMIL